MHKHICRVGSSHCHKGVFLLQIMSIHTHLPFPSTSISEPGWAGPGLQGNLTLSIGPSTWQSEAPQWP